MDNPLLRPSAQSLQKPQVYVKLEFGMSWSGQHPPHRRGFKYRSRALRERNPDFPRHVPAATTNYLAARSSHQSQPSHQILQSNYQDEPQFPEHFWDSQPPHYTYTDHLVPEPLASARRPSRPIEAIPEPPPLSLISALEPRPSSGSGERHRRGRSAPAPLSDNNWDVVHQWMASDCAAGSSNEPTRAVHRPSVNVWKDLPEVPPTQFRLGEEGLPWEGTWTLPMGYEPFLEPDPYQRPEESSHGPSMPTPPPFHPHTAGPVSTTLQPPRLQPSPPQPLGDDRAQRRELEALGSAMMTIDNGFEGQWWNQQERGERRQLAALPPPPAPAQHAQAQQMALGWAGAGGDAAPGGSGGGAAVRGVSPESAVVSPVSSYGGPVTRLARSMSTRSDETVFGARYT